MKQTPKDTTALPDWAFDMKPEQLGRILRAKEAAAFLGVARVTLYRYTKNGTIPEPLHLSSRARGWRLADLLKAQAGMQQPAAGAKGG